MTTTQIARHAQPLVLSSANCVALVGLSWKTVVRFARAHDVPVWRFSERKQLVPAGPLLDALQRASAARPSSLEADVARIEAELAAELAR